MAILFRKSIPAWLAISDGLASCGVPDPGSVAVVDDFRAHRAEYEALVEAVAERPYIQSLDVMSDGSVLVEPKNAAVASDRRRSIETLVKARSIYGLNAGPWGERPTRVTIRYGTLRLGGDGRLTVLEYDRDGFPAASGESYRSEDGHWRVMHR